MKYTQLSALTCSVLLVACSTPDTVFVQDSGAQIDQPSSDITAADSGQVDSQTADVAPTDAGSIDVGMTDTGPQDTGLVDVGTAETGLVDTGVPDTGPVDTGVLDTGALDTGSVDVGVAETGSVEAGVVDSGPADVGSVCAAGFADCDGNMANGCEAHIQTSVTHCGMCGRMCSAPIGGSATCVGGTCTASCPSGQTNCSGTCRTLGTDASNCGACDRACSSGQTCTGGNCVTSSQCFSLDFTAGGYAEVPRTPMLDMTSTWSVTFWARARVTGSNGNFWTDGYEGRAWSSYAVVPLGGQVAYAARSANTVGGTTLLAPNAPGATNAGTVLTGIFLPASSWVHVAVVVDRTSGRAYLDGTMRHNVTLNEVDPFQPGYDFRVGNYLAVTNHQSFDGYLSDIAVWHRALTASEVTTLASGNPGMLRTDPSLAVWLAGDEGNGTRVADVSGRNNHATLTGARWVASCPPRCDSGMSGCACPSGQTNCSGTCRTLGTDASNCGACGRACSVGQTCVGGDCATQSPVLLSMGRSASQSSTFMAFPASGTNDGVYSTFAHTNVEVQPWWQVDLGAMRAITSVRVWNRRDCCQTLAANFDVLVSLDGSTWSDYAYQSGVAMMPSVFTREASARFVRVRLRDTAALHLGEVEVYGF